MLNMGSGEMWQPTFLSLDRKKRFRSPLQMILCFVYLS
jgi:hypothetical protein